MSSEDNHFHDRRFGQAHLRGNWTMLYTSWDYLLNPDSIAINQDDGISYPVNPVQRYIFRSILGTDNWLHRPPLSPAYACILMPLVDCVDNHMSESSSDESSGRWTPQRVRDRINGDSVVAE